MPAYLVGIYRHPSREAAERADTMCAPDFECEHGDTEIHDTPPVVLSGLVKGGEYASAEDWCDNIGPLEVLATAADGRVVSDYDDARSAEARGALPITWYRYEAP